MSKILLVFFSLRGRYPYGTAFGTTVTFILDLILETSSLSSAGRSSSGAVVSKYTVTSSLPIRWSIMTWYSLEAPSIVDMTSSNWAGNMLHPLTLTMSSVLPTMMSILGNLEPQGQSPGIILVRSWVLYLTSGAPSFLRVVMTSSPTSPSGSTSPVAGSIISK